MKNIEISGQLELLKKFGCAQVFEVTQASDGRRKRTAQVLVVGEIPAKKQKNRRQSPHMLETNAKNSNSCACMETQIKSDCKSRNVSYKVCNSDRDWMSPERDPDNPKLESLLQEQTPRNNKNNNNRMSDELLIYKMDD